MDAMPAKGSDLFYANLPNNCIHECPAPKSSQKFPCLYRFQSAVVFSGRPTTELGAEQDFFLLVESVQGRSRDGWLRVRRRVLATARSSFPFIFYESNLVPTATAHSQEVFGQQAVFARAGK